MKCVLTTLVSIFLFASFTPAQSFHWAKQIGGNLNDSSNSIAYDNSGNSYVADLFSSTADFDTLSSNQLLINSNGDFDDYVCKLDEFGLLVWVVQIGGSGRDIGSSVSIDNAWNVYAKGSFEG